MKLLKLTITALAIALCQTAHAIPVYLFCDSFYCQEENDKGALEGTDEIFFIVSTVYTSGGTTTKSVEIIPGDKGEWEGKEGTATKIQAAISPVRDLKPGEAITHFITMVEQDNEGARDEMKNAAADYLSQVAQDGFFAATGIAIPDGVAKKASQE